MRTATHPAWRLSETPRTVSRLTRDSRNVERWFFIAAALFAVVLTPAMIFLQLRSGFALTIGLLVAVVLAIIMIFWPVAGVYALAICAVVVEQAPLPNSIFTDRLYIFSWPTNLQGLPERPIGFLMLFIFLLLIGRRLAGRQGAPLKLGPIILPFVALLICVAIGVIHGLSSGGDPKIIVLEVRPFWYLFVTYLLAYNLITHKRHVIALLWITVVGTIFKALQGTYIVVHYLGGHTSGQQNEIMAHEQSFFFVLVLLIIIMSLMLNRMRMLMWIALLSTPFLLIALIANNRRADYVALLIALVGAWLFAIVTMPKQRLALIWSAVIVAALFSGYVLAFQNASGSVGVVAKAVVSVVRPSATDQRDIASNFYRDIENLDLKYTERQSPIIGWGFGRPFLQPQIPLPNIAGLDPYYLYIPHNTLYWIWMRLGPLGYVALWYLVAIFIVRSGIMARTLRDPDLRFVAIFAIGAMLMEIPLAYGDYQLFFYRNIFFLGLLMGAVMRLPALDTPAEEVDATSADDKPVEKARPHQQALPAWRMLALANSLTPRGSQESP